MLAIHAAARGIDHLGSLTVCGGAVQPGRASARLYGRMIELTDHLPGISAEGRGPLLTWILGPEGARAYLRGGRADASVVRPTMEALASLDLLDDLRLIRVPVTFLHGRYDQLRMQEIEFTAAAPRGRLEVLPYGNHMVNLNRPHRLHADLLRVLARAVGWDHAHLHPARRLRARRRARPLPAALEGRPPVRLPRAGPGAAVRAADRARRGRGGHVLRAPAAGGRGPAPGPAVGGARR